MDFETGLATLDKYVFGAINRHLKDIEIIVLRGSWLGLSYDEIGDRAGYAAKYLRQDVGFKLWKMLSQVLGEEVSKNNFRSAMERINVIDISSGNNELIEEYPDGSVPLSSPFYIDRFPPGDNLGISLEKRCYHALTTNGALIRIKAPYKMGKTSLLDRLIAQSNYEGYYTVKVNLLQAEPSIFNDLDRFLRWFCSYITHKLKLPSRLSEYWDEYRGSIVNATTYFQAHILEAIPGNLVLGLDEVDRLFEYPTIAQGFFAMLRSWHEEAKTVDIWENLRLIIVYSTENYGTLDINQSPFNVGLVVELPDFTKEQVQTLTINHGLHYADREIDALMAMIGGHPYLVRLALYHLSRNNYSLNKLLVESPTNGGIYEEHLRRYLHTLHQNTNLHRSFSQVIEAESGIVVETIAAYQLYSMGLVKRLGDKLVPSYQLYQQYFKQH
jgi:hypothetical protein